MDPITALGAAGSVVGIADVAFQLVKSISKAYSEIASTEVVLRTIIDEVESMGTALSQISDLVSAEERNVKQGLGFKLFTRTALSDVRKTAEKCLVVFWRIEGTILDKAGTSDFEKNIEARRAEFRKQVRGKGKGTGREFQLTEDLADVATSFFRRTKWQLKGTIPKLREYCDQLRGYQLVFTVMLATINLQTSQQRHDWGAIVIALTQISTVDQQKSIPAVLADLSEGDQKERVLSLQKNKSEETRTPQVEQSSPKEHQHLSATNQIVSEDKEPHQVGGKSQVTPPQPHSDTPEKLFPGNDSTANTIPKQSNDHQTALRTLRDVPEHLETKMTENGAAIKSVSTPAHSQREKVEDDEKEVGLASLSNIEEPEEALVRSLSGWKPATEDKSEHVIPQDEVKGYNKPSITDDSGTAMPESFLSTNEAGNNNAEDLDREHNMINQYIMAAHVKVPGKSIPSSIHDLSPRVATLSELRDPKETASIRDVSPSASLHYLGRTMEPPKLVVGPENSVSVTSDSYIVEESNDHNVSEDRSRLVFIVKDGLAQPAPPLSNRGLNRSLTGPFNLRSPRDLGYREFAFLNDLDRKAIDSLLEDAKLSKQASVQMKILKKSSLLGFGKAKSAILVMIEEPGKSRQGDRSITNRSSDGASTAKNNSKSSHDKEMSDEDYIQELTTYKVISIQPLLDVQRPKTSITKTEWDNCVRTELTLDRTEIMRRLTRIDKDGLSVANKRNILNSQQHLQIQTVLVEAARANTDLGNYEYTIRQLELLKKRVRLWSLTPVILAIVVYLQRSPRPHADLESLFAARHSRRPSYPPSPLLRYPDQDRSLFAPPPPPMRHQRLPQMQMPPRQIMMLERRPPVAHPQPKFPSTSPPPPSSSDVVFEKTRLVERFSPARSYTTTTSGTDVIAVELERAESSRSSSSSSYKPSKKTGPPKLIFAQGATTKGAHPRPFPGPPPPPPPPMPGLVSVPVPQQQMPQQMATTKTTYTRMGRRHLSLECLKVRGIEYELDANPDYVIIKRWLSPEEQKELWSLTKVIRDGREKVTTTLAIEDRGHHHHHHRSGEDLVVMKKAKRGRNQRSDKKVRNYMVSAVDDSPDRAVIGGLIGNRIINGSKRDIIEDKSTGRSRSRSRARSDSSKGGGDGGGDMGRAALATAGLGAIGAKKAVDNIRDEQSRPRRRDDSRDSYYSRYESRRRCARSRSRSVVDKTSGQFPPTVSQQPSGATGIPKGTLPGVDKDIVNMLLRRWTPGAAEVSDESEERASEDEGDVTDELGDEEA